jgi:endonuclease G
LASSAAVDAPLLADVPDGAGVALFNNSSTFDLSTRLDAVGFSGVSDSVYREGTGLTPAGGVTTDAEISFVRRMPNGTPTDNDDNQADFIFVSTDGGIYNSRQSTLGSPGAENSSSPISAGPMILLDPTKPSTMSPNRVRDLGNSNAPNGTNVTLSVRRTFVNNTGVNITRLRFRVVDITTLPAPAGNADLRALTSGSVVVSISGVDHTVSGTTLETPPNQTLGGGINSTLTVASVSAAAPLANGAKLDLQFLLGVNNSEANFRFLVTAEAITQAPLSSNEHLTMGNPSNATTDVGVPLNYLMDKPQYALSYNRDRGIPNWLSWHLDPTWLGSAPRQNDYRADTSLPAGWYQVLETDYSGSGFDRGHHCPSGDRTSTVSTNSATFLMTNMMPQAPDNNQGPWNDLEIYCRTLINAGNELYIITGGVGQGGSGSNGGTTNTVASGHVTVPAQTWKVIIVIPQGTNDVSRVTASTRTIAVIMPNSQGIRTTAWQSFRVSVDQVEALTGYDFFSNVPVNIQAAIESVVDNQ